MVINKVNKNGLIKYVKVIVKFKNSFFKKFFFCRNKIVIIIIIIAVVDIFVMIEWVKIKV